MGISSLFMVKLLPPKLSRRSRDLLPEWHSSRTLWHYTRCSRHTPAPVPPHIPRLLAFLLPVPLDEPLLPLSRSDLGSLISGISLIRPPWPEFTHIQTSPKSLESRNHSKE